MSLLAIFNRLYRHYGTQHWWPGETPFEIMVGAVLTQNTAWSNVERAIHNLQQAQALSAERIVAAHPAQVAAWIKPAGYFNVKARRLKNYCRWYLQAGAYHALARLPTAELRHGLLSVNGVGPETADDILLYAFERDVFVIDAYTRRLFYRLGKVQGDESYEALRQLFEQGLQRSQQRGHYKGSLVSLYNEYHALIVRHAKDYCRKQPLCQSCCLRQLCPYAKTAVAA